MTDKYLTVGALKAANKFPPPNWTHLEDTTSMLEQPREMSM